MTLPNFLIIGAAKSGTTSLYYYLKGHPQIYMSPVKEPEFFSFMGQSINRKDPTQTPAIFSINNQKDYEALFKKVRDEIAVGEASPSYIYVPETPARIKAYIPHAKLIAILRHPIERAYSHFTMRRNKGYEAVAESIQDFTQAVRQEEKRIHEGWQVGWHYVRRGFYYEQLKRYYDLFDPRQIRVYLYEDLRSRPLEVLKDIFRFLGVNESYEPDTKTIHNQGKYQVVVKNDQVHRFLTGENFLKNLVKPFMKERFRKKLKRKWVEKNLYYETAPSEAAGDLTPELRKELLDRYRPDILKLQDLIGRDLSAWLR